MMKGYENNSQCILDYLTLFQALSAEEADAERCRTLWRTIRIREQLSAGVRLAPPSFRLEFRLGERDFLLAMAALALEMDGELRHRFRRNYALSLPTVEYGLRLISPVCPGSCETPADLAGRNVLCGLLLTAAGLASYPLERPLILCRTALAFLTGFSIAEIPGCTALTEEGRQWLSLYENELAQVKEWRACGTENTLYLCAPGGSGRKTLLRRACENVVWADIAELSRYALLDQEHALREIAVLATLLHAPVCASPDSEACVFRQLEQLCRRYGVPLAALVEEDGSLQGAKEVVRLPWQLSPEQRQAVWNAFVPEGDPEAAPLGAASVGTVRETALLARRIAAAGGRQKVTQADTRQAMRRRGGALEFGVRYQTGVTLDEMVLSGAVREQLELICQAALCGGKLASWGLPRQREGVTAVFHGPSGTGKTLAASAIAHRLGMPLLRTDLSLVVDKYVGETEKHLGRLFRSARENHCVLLFDEADSLFGKRAQVSSGNDRYANLSTSYLLQEIEQYDGVAILSTNLLSNFDEAFLRRLHYIVRFGLPDAGLRELLWRRTLPPERCGEALPYAQLAQAELSPARILAAVRGAYIAASAAGRTSPLFSDIGKSLKWELEKSSKPLPHGIAERMGGNENESAKITDETGVRL